MNSNRNEQTNQFQTISSFEFGDIIPQEDRTDGIVGRRDSLIERYILTEDKYKELKKLGWSEKSISEQQVMVMRSGGYYYITSIDKLIDTLELVGHVKAAENQTPNTSMLVTYICRSSYTDPKKSIESKLDWLKENKRITKYKFIGKGNSDAYYIRKTQHIYKINTNLNMRLFSLNIHAHNPSSFEIYIQE